MSLFDSASLVVTPNGQKAGKLYSIKPTDGSGDLSVTRATSATRVDANGLVEIPRTNLATYSEDFTNSNWTKVATTISSNATTAPNGTLTADKLIPSSANSSHIIYQNIGSIGDVRMLSCYVKKIDYRYVTLQYGTASCRFDFDTLTFTGGTNNGYEALPNGWYRIYTTLTATINARFNIFIPDNSGNVSYIGDGTSGTFIWGAMAQEGNVATEYIPTVASIRTKFAGITQDGGSASNIPRLDYTNGSCPSILVEPQRTNLCLRSEEFDNAIWSKSGTTISANTTTSPSGTTTADKIVEVTAASLPRVSPIGTVVTLVSHTITIFAKAAERTQIRIVADSSAAKSAYYDLINGTIVNVGASAIASITLYNNGWYRCVLTYTPALIGNGFYIATAENGNTIASGDNTKGVFLWGAQLELGANATSYIPTTSASVTRNADVISKTGISSLIGQTEGTIFAEINNTLRTYQEGYLIRMIADVNNEIWIRKEGGSNTYSARFRANSVNVYTKLDINVLNGNNKIAFAYKSGNFAIYLNGTQVSTSTAIGAFSTTVGDLSLGFSGTSNFNDRINLVTLWKERLSNDQLAQLTTL